MSLPGTKDRVLIAIFGRNSPAKLVKQRESFVMFSLPSPLPKPLKGRPIRHGMTKHLAWPFVRLAGREWYFPSRLTLWRKGDKVTVQFTPWQDLRRWLFTRCEGCGKRLPYGSSPVSMLEWVHRGKTNSVQLGEAGCYHWGCAKDPAASNDATQSWDRQWGHDDVLRRHVLNEPVDVALELSMLAQVRRDADERYRRRLVESRREHGLPAFTWEFPREETDRAAS